MIARLFTRWRSRRAWDRFQAHYARLEQSAVTQTVGRARRERSAIVNAALAGGRK